MKKLLLCLLVGASIAMAGNVPIDDLLSVATQGKTTGSQFEMSKSEMKNTDGGYRYSSYSRYNNYRAIGSYFYNRNTRSAYSSNAHTRIYARAWGSYYWETTAQPNNHQSYLKNLTFKNISHY